VREAEVMSAVADRYGRLAEAFATKIAAVAPDRWSSQSPCAEWTARDVVGHVVETHGMFLGFVGQELGSIPSVADDPAGAFAGARAAVQANLDDPARATAEYDGFSGRTTFETAIDGFICLDLVVHGWDLARATGLDERIDPEEVRRARDRAAEFGDLLRSPGVCGPEVEVAPDADDQTKLLAFLGRHP
jgi:uncharacterized protein (TIGR03086 family)